MYMCISMYEYVHRYEGASRPKWEDRPSAAGVTGRCEHPNRGPLQVLLTTPDPSTIS